MKLKFLRGRLALTTCSQGWQSLAAMLTKRQNFDRNYLDDPRGGFPPNFAV